VIACDAAAVMLIL